MVLVDPVGVVAAVIPWNAPHQSALLKVIPALLAGNSVILKASPETALDALAMANLFNESDLPKGVISIVPAHLTVKQVNIKYYMKVLIRLPLLVQRLLVKVWLQAQQNK